MMILFRGAGVALVTCFLLVSGAVAKAEGKREQLMAVLRESPGANRPDESLSLISKIETTLPNGQRIEMAPAWFQYIGDMHIRFVFDEPASFRSASQDDLKRLGLTPEQALALALENMKRTYGRPRSRPWSNVFEVVSQSPDLQSSYFLDREFWLALSNEHPSGIVVAVPKRGGLIYTPRSNERAVEALQKGVTALYRSSENLRVSAALYLFKDGKWSVFQPAPKQ
jgi:hypothetical protein